MFTKSKKCRNDVSIVIAEFRFACEEESASVILLNYLPAEDRKRQWGIGNYECDRDDETAAAIFYCVHEENEEEDLSTELFIRIGWARK